MPLRTIIALAVSVAVATPVVAQSADGDVRCILAGNTFGAIEKDPGRKQLALATALFFAGRADARIPPAQFRALVAAQGKALSSANVAEVMTACAKQFQAKERAMQAIGEQVAQTQHPNTKPQVRNPPR